MQKTKKKSFDWYGMRQHFSIRKYHFGAASVLLGMSLALGAGAQAVQAEETLASSETTTTTVASTTDSSASSEAVVTETTVASSTETAVSASETATTTSSTEASTTETVATATATSTERSAAINYIVQYVLEDGTVVKADVKLATVSTTEATAKTSVTVATELPAGYELASGQTATVTQEVTEGAANVVTVKVVKKAEATATTESKATETASSETTTSTETKAATTEAVAETVKTPATVEEAKVVLEQVTSEAEVLANESERLVAASDKENTALKAAATATKLTATEATAVLNDSTATLEAVNEQIDAVRTNVEALALELRKFLGTDLIQVALTTTTTVENGNGLTGTWVEDETVTNKEEASSAATVIPSSQEFPAGYVGDPSDKRTTFMIYSLSGLSDSGITPGTLDGSFNLRRGTDLYMVLSVNRSTDDGDFLYLNLYDKKTGQIALDDNGNKIQEELAVAVGQTKELTGLNAYAKQSNLTNKFKYTLSLTETEFKNAAGESSVLRNMQLKSGMGGTALNTLVYSNQTLSRGDYNDYSGTAPTYSPRQVTSYFVKATDLRDEEFLASYTQNGDLAGDLFTIAGESIFDNYELIESPTTTNGTLAADYVAGTALIRWYAGSLQSKVQYITKDDGSARYLQFLVNPDHPDFLETYAKYKTMSETNFQAEGETVFRLAERIAIVEKVEKDIAAVNADTTLSDEEKTAKIQTIRTEATAKINTADDKFFLTYSGENLDPLDYNDTADVVTGLDEWNYTSTKYKFSANNVTSATLSSKVGEYQGYPKAIWNNVNTGILTILDQDGKPVVNPHTNTTMTFKAHQLSMFNSNGANFNNQRYYYAEKGGLKVYYVDTEGTVIKDENFVMPHENTDTPYDTATEEVKPKTITYKGEVYYYKEIDMISDNSLVPASQNTETEKRTIKKIDQETGVIEQDTLKELTYVYEKAGNVNINYVDTEGIPLKNKVIDVENGKPGSDYNTAQNKSEKPDTITTDDGTVYHLVPTGDYPVGNVSDNNNLTSVGNGTATGIDPVTGTVVAGETKEITYVYQKAGSVNINYVDTDGKVLQPKLADVENGKPGSDYNTAQNKTEKPDTITTEDGTVYHLVPAGDYPVGNVSDTNNLTSVGNGRATGIDPVTGEVVAGETKEITYVYQKAGNVNVNYVDTKGNVIKDKVADEVNEPAGTDYDTVVDNKPEKITTEDGKVYYLAPAATYEVGTVSDDNNLTSVGNGTATGIDPITGEVEAGETKEITYVYQEAGHVNVNYVDTDGNVIKLPVVDVKDGKPGSDYDTVVDNKPTEILYDGKLYRLVPAGTYNVGTVGESNDLTTVGNGKATGIDPVIGDVVAGETKEITYVYKLVTGNVVITYVDTDGNVLKSEVKDTTDKEPGTPYDTKEGDKEYPSSIEKDGETYYRVEKGEHKVGETTEDGHLVSSDKPEGEVEEGTKTVTYVYQKAGNVNINYVDTEGKPLQAPVSDTVNGKPGTDYDTTESSTTKTEKPDTITTADGKVYKLVPAGDYPVGNVSDDNNLTSVGNGKATGIDPVTGKVVAGETKEITYVYKLVTGNVVITYVDTEGTPLKSEVKDTTDKEPGTPYNTKEGDNEYPSTIEKDGETYYRVEAGNHTVGNTTEDGHLVSSDDPSSTVEEGTKTVTYVYQKAGNVNVNYVDTEGNVLKAKVADVVNGKPGSDYDTVVDNKPTTITTEDGKTYKLVPAGSYKVGVVGANNNLTEVGNGKATGVDTVTGDVVAG
ncbi:TPA: MucBP domain-containing protein, partial [Streptococcus suis]